MEIESNSLIKKTLYCWQKKNSLLFKPVLRSIQKRHDKRNRFRYMGWFFLTRAPLGTWWWFGKVDNIPLLGKTITMDRLYSLLNGHGQRLQRTTRRRQRLGPTFLTYINKTISSPILTKYNVFEEFTLVFGYFSSRLDFDKVLMIEF